MIYDFNLKSGESLVYKTPNDFDEKLSASLLWAQMKQDGGFGNIPNQNNFKGSTFIPISSVLYVRVFDNNKTYNKFIKPGEWTWFDKN
ncbi:hypothetical protein [Furfurilactobacillus milii]|uniref:Uncharacterized protein n=1 Tax=Furfurilactobacillus rossiae TaxID=231049 RepID=A0A7C9MPU0_9LACO|nr:hypothetical protein [Furfurilactobacillus milii]MYV05303.1 hypothetical protein [Furfurilactobacillus milii]